MPTYSKDATPDELEAQIAAMNEEAELCQQEVEALETQIQEMGQQVRSCRSLINYCRLSLNKRFASADFFSLSPLLSFADCGSGGYSLNATIARARTGNMMSL